jgi:hypothetical protein
VVERTAIVAYGDSDVAHVLRSAPVLDRPATAELVRKAFPDNRIDDAGDALLYDCIDPGQDMAYVGSFRGVELICSWRLVDYRPSQAARRCLPPARLPHVYLHSMDGGTNRIAFAAWQSGTMVRSLSLAADDEVVENLGEPLAFETPFWAGERTADPDESDGVAYAYPFRPRELAEEALRAFFGFGLDGMRSVDDVDPEVIPLLGYRIR